MKKLLLALLLSGLAIVSVRADYLWNDGFLYPDGQIINNSGGLWIRHSGSGNDANVASDKLQIGSSGTGGRQDDIHRWLSTTNASIYTNNSITPLYASLT